MRGIGGPLLCIGDLLSDVGEDNSNDKGDYREPGSFSSSSSNSSDTNITHSPSLDLTEMFQATNFISVMNSDRILDFSFKSSREVRFGRGHLYNSFASLNVDVESIDKFADSQDVEGFVDPQELRRTMPNPRDEPAVGNGLVAQQDRRERSPQENYNQLNQALAGNDHSWTALTLKLCSALETADKLVQSTNSNISQLTEKVGVLQSMVSRGDAAVKDLKVIHDAQCKQERSSTIGG
ncbi:hypothetical protein GIB67_018960 [Kingdonia uniflora]|uniref:Uncharacterized protein n=1 Tax=Kingdonia uniflora TaxID=39325 RepID=A0A7J7NVD9_9MAGN|nr:hypothetical protein GIB67_018960 [Kingdonia uniflora]